MVVKSYSSKNSHLKAKTTSNTGYRYRTGQFFGINTGTGTVLVEKSTINTVSVPVAVEISIPVVSWP